MLLYGKAFLGRPIVQCPLLSDLERSGLQSKFRGWARLRRDRLQCPGDANLPAGTLNDGARQRVFR